LRYGFKGREVVMVMEEGIEGIPLAHPDKPIPYKGTAIELGGGGGGRGAVQRLQGKKRKRKREEGNHDHYGTFCNGTWCKLG
jgi:hypothetical protein